MDGDQTQDQTHTQKIPNSTSGKYAPSLNQRRKICRITYHAHWFTYMSLQIREIIIGVGNLQIFKCRHLAMSVLQRSIKE